MGCRLQDISLIDAVLLWCDSLDDVLAQPDWEKVVELATRMGEGETLSDQQLLQLTEARRRVAARDALVEALRSGNEWEIQRCYLPKLLDDFPGASLGRT